MHFNIGLSRTDSQATWSSHLCRTLIQNTARYRFHWTFCYCITLLIHPKPHIDAEDRLSWNMNVRLRMYKVLLFKFRRRLCKGSIVQTLSLLMVKREESYNPVVLITKFFLSCPMLLTCWIRHLSRMFSYEFWNSSDNLRTQRKVSGGK